jgi:dGTPase
VQLLEYKGQQVVIEIFEALSSDPERLLPEYTKNLWIKAKEEGNTKKSMRVICDYIAGMTDDYASKIHRALFVAGDGSIFNRL